MPARAAAPISKPGSARCASGCRTRRRWRTGSTATPAAAWCSAATRRRCAGSGALFAEGKVEKVYWAVVAGIPAAATRAVIDAPLKKATRRSGWRMVIDPAGQRAVTEYRVLGNRQRPRLAGIAAAHRAHPSDSRALRRARLPGRRRPDLWRTGGAPLQLHARAIAMPLYPAKPAIQVIAPPPPHMLARARPSRLRSATGLSAVTMTTPIELRRLGPEDAALYRDIRLEGLADSPTRSAARLRSSRIRARSPVRGSARRRFTVLGAFSGTRLLGVAGFSVQPGPKHRAQGHVVGHVCAPACARCGVRPDAGRGDHRARAPACRAAATCSSSATTRRPGAFTRSLALSNTGSSAMPQSIAAYTTMTC